MNYHAAVEEVEDWLGETRLDMTDEEFEKFYKRIKNTSDEADWIDAFEEVYYG